MFLPPLGVRPVDVVLGALASRLSVACVVVLATSQRLVGRASWAIAIAWRAHLFSNVSNVSDVSDVSNVSKFK